jgi:hypothetical protein
LLSNAQANLTGLFQQYHAAGVLGLVRAIYPQDEPDLAGFSDATMVATVALIKKVAAGYPELAGLQTWTIYGDTGATPGMSAIDCVGKDNYGQGSGALGWYGSLPAGKCQILIPGGSDPWKTDPTAFVNYALATPSVICLLPFIWVDWSGGAGINRNSMLSAYRAAGKRILVQK